MANTTVTVLDTLQTVIVSSGPIGTGSTFQTIHTYAIGGNLAVASGETDFIPPFFFFKKSNQSSVIKKVVHQIHAGTSATVKLQKNGVDLTGYTAISATTTKTTTNPATPSLADGDTLALVVTAVTGTPQNLTFTVVIEHTVS